MSEGGPHNSEHNELIPPFSVLETCSSAACDDLKAIIYRVFPEVLDADSGDIQELLVRGLGNLEDFMTKERMNMPRHLSEAASIRIYLLQSKWPDDIERRVILKREVRKKFSLNAALTETLKEIQDRRRGVSRTEVQELLARLRARKQHAIKERQTSNQHSAQTGDGSSAKQSTVSRRTLLKGGAAVAAAYGVWKAPEAADWLTYKFSGDAIESRLSTRFRMNIQVTMFEKEHPMTKKTAGGGLRIEYGLVDPVETYKQRLEILLQLEEYLSVYPPEIFSLIGMRQMTIAKHFKSQSRRGYYVVESWIGGNFSNKVIGLFPRHFLGNHFKRTIHHEIGHALTDDAQVISNWVSTIYGSNAHANNQAQTNPKAFVSKYARRDVHEDIASTFEMMMDSPRFAVSGHPEEIINKKIDFLKKHIERITQGKLGQAFWRHLDEQKVQGPYWDSTSSK